MEEKRKVIKRKNVVRVVIVVIAVALWQGMFILTNNNFIIAIIVLVLGAIVVFFLLKRMMLQAQKDCKIMREKENMEKAKRILSDSSYTLIRCAIDLEDIQGGWYRIEALKSIVSTQAELLKEFDLALAAKLNEDKILYAIVDENGNEIRKVDMYDTATFFMNNFEKI